METQTSATGPPTTCVSEKLHCCGCRSDGDGSDSEGGPKRGSGSRPRKPHLQGRFSGRLETKQDEKRLANECRLLGPLLGGRYRAAPAYPFEGSRSG